MSASETVSARSALSPAPPLSNDQERSRLIEAELNRLLAAQALTGFIEGILAFGVVILVFWHVVALWRLLVWTLVMGLLNLPGVAILRWFHQEQSAPQHRRQHQQSWATLFTIAYGLSGIGWGVSAFLVFPLDSLPHQFFLVFILGGQAAGGMTALSSVPKVMLAFLCTTLLPVVVKLCLLSDSVMMTVGLVLFGFGVAMILIGQRLHGVLEETLILRFENLDLVHDLSFAKENAEAANRAKSQFLANISHELRTPMNGVLGMVEILSRTPLTARQQQLVRKVQSSGEVLLTTINDLLDLAKIEAGKFELEHLNFQVRELVSDVINFFAESATRKGLRLDSLVAPDVPETVRGDPARLRQVLTNLVNNALKFTAQGEVFVEVRRGQDAAEVPSFLDHEAENSCVLSFSVRDTGIGISAEMRERIFESFAQADESTTRKYGGTGLGLSIAKQLTRLMGGEIGVESRESQGSVFWFTARLAIVHASRTTMVMRHVARPPSYVQPLEPLPLLRPLQVLLAEDNEVNQEVTKGLLELLGCRVQVVSNGKEALEAMHTHVLDVVLMDCQMPEMDGFMTTAEIRHQEVHAGKSRIPIIALTAHAMVEDRERCLSAGMDDYLGKPFSPYALRDVLMRWLPGKEAKNGTEAYAALDEETFTVFRTFANEGAPSLFSSIIQTYLDTTPQLMETLHHAVSRSEASTLRYAAHTLKSSSASLGALALADLCKDLEATSEVGNVTHAIEILPTLEAEYRAVREALSVELERSVER